MKNWIYIATFLAGILVGSVIINVHAQNINTKVKWEYKVEYFGSFNIMEKGLNKFALEGWEVVGLSNYTVILRREIAN
jgi:hypothetical protein